MWREFEMTTKCNGICERFLNGLRRVRSGGAKCGGPKNRYDLKTYNVRVTRGISFYSKEEYLRCSQCNIFLHRSLHLSDNYVNGMGPKRCPCCGTQLSNRHNK
jgi:hypothetical protein